MKWTFKTILELVAIVAMVAVVCVLALLQYRWTSRIGGTEQQRLKSELAADVRNFSQEFSYDFQRMCEGLEIDPDAPPSQFEGLLLHQYSNWKKTTTHSSLVDGLLIWRTDGPRGPYLEALDQQGDRFQQVPWPAELESLHGFITQQEQRFGLGMPDRETVYYPWTFYEDTPALIRPLFDVSSADTSLPPEIRPVGFLVVQLSGDYLTRQYLPELVNRNFAASEFVVAVRGAGSPYRSVYISNQDLPITASPDAAINLFDAVGEEAKRRGHPPLQPSQPDRQWQLVAQYSAGSLEVAMAAWRRRNLVISLGLLALLFGSAVLLFSAARRAERLASLQMEFVAGVSHELCAPLAVINSAAENLVDGIVDDPGQIREYGGMIRDQGRRLERLVDEVLLFAAGRFGRAVYDLRPVEVAPMIAQSLGMSESMLREAGFAVDKEISSDLPRVVADPAAASKCIENLVSNAMKYAGASKWIGVRAQLAPAARQPEVLVSVQDKGIGISAADLPHIFEPFYRVQAVRDGQIRGVGLGLYLVKRMMEAMGGRVTVSSEPGRGTFFTLHFPAAQPTDQPQGEAAWAQSHT